MNDPKTDGLRVALRRDDRCKIQGGVLADEVYEMTEWTAVFASIRG